jgi:hypothetical protein
LFLLLCGVLIAKQLKDLESYPHIFCRLLAEGNGKPEKQRTPMNIINLNMITFNLLSARLCRRYQCHHNAEISIAGVPTVGYIISCVECFLLCAGSIIKAQIRKVAELGKTGERGT